MAIRRPGTRPIAPDKAMWRLLTKADDVVLPSPEAHSGKTIKVLPMSLVVHMSLGKLGISSSAPMTSIDQWDKSHKMS